MCRGVFWGKLSSGLPESLFSQFCCQTRAFLGLFTQPLGNTCESMLNKYYTLCRVAR